ncbi:dnaJ homolog subfamily C member 11-like [Gigantopelta aegis]|uniref:dnaJ homolog subfamily C member 11-like n=1 Tax=Gigantopelta aegis TaxID=1735272 RepID=UPI001B8883CC|nr:dnaJ homolog subfamily C member 11-like [Gigantopelta aegis]
MDAPFADEEDLFQSDFYSLLNVSKDASTDEINYAFRRLSKMYHPDKHMDQLKKKQAEIIFGKLKRAHEVLIDKHRRTVYDMYGEKGLETEGLEVISRVKSPAEIIAEYERLQREKEERRLQQRTNPRGTVSVGINATDIFDSYDPMDVYGDSRPGVEMSSMSVFQSVECPLTTRDTAIIAGNISTHNGNGTGAFLATWRRLTSDKGWMEMEGTFGSEVGGSVKGFRQISKRCFGTASCSLQTTSRGIRPSTSTMLAYQFDRNFQGRLTWNAGIPSALSSVLVFDNQDHHAVIAVQLGKSSTFLSMSYTRKLQEHEAKMRAALRLGLTGWMLEYGFEKKITQFSVLGATMVIGLPQGVSLRIKLYRGNQTFFFPIHLSENLSTSAIFYGTVIPVVTFFAVKRLIVDPFLQQQKERELEKTREEHSEKMARRKREAEAAVDLMQETVERSIEAEENKIGLIVVKGLYGKLQCNDDGELIDKECIDVTVQLQALVKDSKLILPENTSKSGLPGFYDPCLAEEKTLFVRYRFRNRLHQITLSDKDPVRLPQQKHVMTDENAPFISINRS